MNDERVPDDDLQEDFLPRPGTGGETTHVLIGGPLWRA